VDGGVGSPRSGTKCARFNVSTKRLVRYLTATEEHATLIVGMGVYKADSNDVAVITGSSDTHSLYHTTVTINANGSVRANRGTSAGTLLGTSAAGVVPLTNWVYFETKITLSATVGVVSCYVDGTQVLNLTGQNTKNGGTKTTYDGFEIGYIAGSGAGVLLDDVYVCNGDSTIPNDILGPCRIRTLWPNGNGANSAGVGSDGNSVNNYQLVQDPVPSAGTATYVDLGGLGDEDTYTFDDLPEVSGTVAGIQTTTYALKTAADTRMLAHVTRIGGTDYLSADLALPTAFGWQVIPRNASPATSVAYTRAEINGAEYGVRAR
jgi:hypothetical protein